MNANGVHATRPWHSIDVRDIRDRLGDLDWTAIERSLWEHGYARTPPVLTADECAELTALYRDESRFRSRVDMARFPTPGHLISWAGLCPRNDESAGKRRSTRVRKSGTWLKTALVTAAWAAVRVKNSYLHAQFMRIKARRGAKKAILAVAASMLTAAYFMLRDQVAYRDLGPQHFDRRHRDTTIRRLIRRLHDLGCEVALHVQPAAQGEITSAS